MNNKKRLKDMTNAELLVEKKKAEKDGNKRLVRKCTRRLTRRWQRRDPSPF